MFGRSWVRFPSGIPIFSVSHSWYLKYCKIPVIKALALYNFVRVLGELINGGAYIWGGGGGGGVAGVISGIKQNISK